MIKLDVDKVQVRYITGINKCLPGYPTPLDVLYESCRESADSNLFSDAKMENKKKPKNNISKENSSENSSENSQENSNEQQNSIE